MDLEIFRLENKDNQQRRLNSAGGFDEYLYCLHTLVKHFAKMMFDFKFYIVTEDCNTSEPDKQKQ